MDRREFIKNSIIGLGGIMILPSCAGKISSYMFFTEDEAKCIIPICEQIIPSDENGPGATTAGVIFYIDKQLNEVFTWEQSMYRKGIAALQKMRIRFMVRILSCWILILKHRFLKKWKRISYKMCTGKQINHPNSSIILLLILSRDFTELPDMVGIKII